MREEFATAQTVTGNAAGLTQASPWWACSRCWMKITGAAMLLVVLIAGATFYMHPMWVIKQAIALQYWSQGVHSEYITAGGYRLHYLVAGEGEPVLLVHGLGSKAEDWGNLIPAIAKGGYKVYAIDLLGYGRSDK